MAKPRESAKIRDIYGLEQKLESAKRNFLEGEKRPTYGRGMANPWAERHVSERNKQIVIEFDAHALFQGKSLQTRYKRFYTLANLTQELAKDFDKLTKDEVKAYISDLNDSNYAPKTIQVKKMTLKLIVKWLAKEKDVPASKKLWEWMGEEVKTTLGVRSDEETLNVDKTNLLKEEEVLEFARFARGKDRAFIMTLYDTGGRIGELLPLKKRDIKFVEGGYALLSLRGKTGLREVPVKSCVPDLAWWINELPEGENQDLWIIEGTRGAGTRYDYRAMMRHIYALGRAWQATKKKPWDDETLRAKLHLHNWRHSRATELAARGWSEYEMCTFFGWKIGSKVPGVYVKISGRKLLSRIRKDMGEIEEKAEPSKLKTVKCPVCNTEQSGVNRVCAKCGMALTQQEFAVQLEKQRVYNKKLEAVQELYEMLVQQPEGGLTLKELAAQARKKGIKPKV